MHPGLLLLISSTAAAVASPAIVLGVDWASLLGRSNLVYSWTANETGPEQWTQSLFGGNGGLGFMLYQPAGFTANALRLSLGRTDVYDDRTSALCTGGAPTCSAFQGNFAIDTPRLPIGYLILDYGAPLVSAVGVVDLWDGVVYGNVTTSAGVLGFRVYGLMDWQATDALVVETETLSGSGAWNVSFSPSPAVSTWADANYVYNPAVDCHDSAALGTLLCTQVHLLNSSHSTAVQTRAGNGTAQATYVSISPVLADAASSDAYAAAQVAAASQLGPVALLAATRAWWHAFWPAGAVVTLNDTVLEAFYYIQIYKFATATQRGRAVHDLEGPWYIDGTNWPDLHWDLNLQQTYYLLLTANRLDISTTLNDFVVSIQDGLALNPPAAWQFDSSAAPTGASSLAALETCYWNYGPGCKTSPPSVTGNLLWTLQLVFLHAQYSQNTTVMTEVLWPTLGRALNFYTHFLVQNGSTFEVPVTFSPEWPGGPGPNANYDIALLRWGLQLAADIATTYNLTNPNLPKWAAILDGLVGYSVDDTGYMIYSNQPYNQPHRHYSHLFAIWPLRTEMHNPANFSLAAKSLDLWLSTPETDSLFYRPAASAMNVMLSRVPAAYNNLTFLIVTSGRIEANTFYREGTYGSCTETPYAAAWAMTDWLLQSWNGSLHVYPGVPDVLGNLSDPDEFLVAGAATASFFSLRAEGGYNVSAARRLVSSSASALETAPLWVAVSAIPGPAAYAAAGGGPVTVRASLPRPLAVDPPGLTFVDNGDGTVTLPFLAQGATAVLYGAAFPPPAGYVVAESAGCPDNYNWWGYHGDGSGASAAAAFSAAPFAPVTLATCSEALAARQQFAYNATARTFVLQDGTGSRCLSIAGCETGSGALVGVAPCVAAPAPQPAGCHGGGGGACFATQQWAVVPGPTGTQLCSVAAPSQCLDVNGATQNVLDVWGPCDPTPCGDGNQQWVVGANGTITSLDDYPGTHFLGACVTAAA